MIKNLTVLLAALLLAPALAVAAPKPRPLLLQPLQDELAAKGEIPKALATALKAGEQCMNEDKGWDQGLKDGLPVSRIYEYLQSAVFCWQTAEKKATKVGDSAEPAASYYAARARYIESFRSYIWGIEAKLAGDKMMTCKRLKVAATEAVIANTASEGLAEKFATDDGKLLGAVTTTSATELGATIASELEHQKCD